MFTDDPNNPTTYLTIQGFVEKVVDITPKTIVFQGDSGDIMEKTITIIPTEKYPLNILDLEFKNGQYLTCELKKTQINGKQAFKILVKIKKDAKNNFYDKVLIKTDSSVKPLISIWVRARLKTTPKTTLKTRPKENPGTI